MNTNRNTQPHNQLHNFQLTWTAGQVLYGVCIRLRNDLYCVEWGVKLYSLSPYGVCPKDILMIAALNFRKINVLTTNFTIFS